MIRLWLAGAALLALGACDPLDWNDPYRAYPTYNGEMRAQDPDTCTAQGGAFGKVCTLSEYTCVTPYPDAGKACTDGAECVGECLADGSAEPGAETSGACQTDDKPCGTFIRVTKGAAEAVVTVD